MKNFDCITIGSCILDTFVLLDSTKHHVDHQHRDVEDQCFALGSKIDVSRIMQQSGGGATNAAATLARQRLSVAIISKIGDDTAGHIVQSELSEDHISTTYLHKVSSGKTGQSVVLVDPNAERSVLTDRGSAGFLSAIDLECLQEIKGRWVYITSLNGSIEALDSVFGWAEEKGVKVAWNPGIKDIEQHGRHINRLIKQTTLFVANKEEAALVCGLDLAEVDELAQALHTKGVNRGIVTDGARSLAVIDGSERWTIMPSDVKAVDQTGAGDACGSGVVAGLLRGLTFRESLKLGLSNAEHVVMKVGAKSGILYRK